jgi:poly(3-hydroxybutyrate) depolymerase
MYDPSHRQAPLLPFIWPALVSAAARDMAALAAECFADLADSAQAQEPQWTTPHKMALELTTVRLRDFTVETKNPPALLCAPFALHGAAIADLAPGHSLVAALRQAGLRRLFVTDWRSATASMRLLGIDDYLADLNVLVDEIGAPVDLIDLCQGGWMALIFAARFPAKVRKLVLAAAPIDIAAAASPLSALADGLPRSIFHELVRLGGGLLSGRKVLKFWGPQSMAPKDIRDLLQTTEPIDSAAFARLQAAFENWYGWTVDLPGVLYLECVEKLYKRNELARGVFVALGQRIDLAALQLPLYLLAARDDELVALPQLFGVENLVGTPAPDLRKAIAPCRHVGLFVAKNALDDYWPRIVGWLDKTQARRQVA